MIKVEHLKREYPNITPLKETPHNAHGELTAEFQPPAVC